MNLWNELNRNFKIKMDLKKNNCIRCDQFNLEKNKWEKLPQSWGTGYLIRLIIMTKPSKENKALKVLELPLCLSGILLG